MLNNDIYHLPVVEENGKIVGIITERDMRWAMASPILEAIVNTAQQRNILSQHKVSEFMTEGVQFVEPEDSVLFACRLMR
jgi:acetoin utilization protein AcuB